MKSKRKVAIVGTVGIPANYGGFETLAEQLVSTLHSDLDFTVYCSSQAYPKSQKSYLNTRLKYLPIKANGISSIFYDMISIIDSLFYADTILLLGVSSAFMIPIVQLLSSKKIIVNVDGQEWKRAKWSLLAKSYLKLQERIAVKYSDAVIADNKVIQENLQQNYQVNSELISYGGSHTQKLEISSDELKALGINNPYYLSVCRIEPENNVHIILEAFARTDELMIFVGNWEASKYGKKLRATFSKTENIKMFDPIYDQVHLDKLRSNCKVYVHGHSAGGTNPSLVEAMYLQAPIFAWDVEYNKITTQENALYFDDIPSLLNLVEENTCAQKLNAMAENLFEIARVNYDWKTIAAAYHKLLRNSY